MLTPELLLKAEVKRFAYMFLCALGESDKELLSPQHDILCAVKQDKRGVVGNSLSPSRASHLPLPSPLQSPNTPPLFAVSPLLCFLLIAGMCCKMDIKACSGFTGWPYCFTGSLTGPPDSSSQWDVSRDWLLDWLAHWGAVCWIV